MKRSLGFTFLFVMLTVFCANAVVIHWAVSDSTLLSSGVSSAQLVYVSDGPPVYVDGSLSNGESLSTVGSSGITPIGIGEQNTTDGTTRSAGNYYIILFSSWGSYRRSDALAFDDTLHITDSLLSPEPSGGSYDPNYPDQFTTWWPVPEPGSAVMMALGVGLLALRRRKQA